MSAPELHRDFADLLGAFLSEGVEFLLVGAFAVAANGAPRHTGDLDVWIRADAANAERVIRGLRIFGAPLAAHGVTAADFSKPGDVYQLGVPPVRIDILTAISGVTFEDAWPNRIEAQVGGLRLAFLGPRELVRNKRASARAKDLQDIELLREAGLPIDDG